jgi:nitrogen fixation protein NifU and related proteins
MSDELEELYQQVILDHSKRPRNRGEIPGAVQVQGDNPSCGDEITLCVKFGTAGEDIKFTGSGCAISQASASLMTMKLKGKSRADALRLAGAFHTLITSETPVDTTGLGDVVLLKGVRKFPQRVKCASLAWRAFEQATSDGGVATTE